jgi:PAS domain S-box-containing protein
MEITARKIAERQSAEAQALLATVIDMLPQRVFWKGKSGKYLGANKAFCREFNLETVAGLTVYDLGLPVKIAALFEAADRQLIESGGEIRDKVVSSMKTRGVPEWVSYSKVPMRNTAGEITGFVGTYLDVTAFKSTEQALSLARDTAEVANRAKTDFLAAMSHEIRTPLNGTLGCLQLLQDTGLNNDQQELAATALNCGRVLLAQLNDILDFSKIENGDFNFEFYEFDARELCLEALELIASRANARGISVDFEWSSSAPTMICSDAQRVRQVLNNLLSNALKFTERGSIRLEVSAESSPVLRFVVRDTGIGVPVDAKERIFEKFAQADASTTRRFGGTGLGLTICRRLVFALGGEIGVESIAGAGATFWFNLPINIESKRSEALPHSLCSQKPVLIEIGS